MIEKLAANVEKEKRIAKEILSLMESLDYAEEQEKEFILKALNSLQQQFKIINETIPFLVEQIEIGRKEEIKKPGLTELKVEDGRIMIERGARERFLKELRISEESIKSLRKRREEKKEIERRFGKPSLFARFSNKFFLKYSTSYIDKGYFKSLNIDLRKANYPYLLSTYISMTFMTTLLTLVVAFFIFIFLLFFSVGLDWPFIILTKENILIRVLKFFGVIFVLPFISFLFMYYSPSIETKATRRKIDEELPFVTLQMAAIAGSDIEPSRIFEIIASTKEYVYTSREAKKLINQINVYGYDFVSALRNSALRSPSKKLAELLNGLATTIVSGGSLVEFFNTRAESLLFDYKLERERYTRLAETFMDIYISVVIAAPLILMLLLVMMNITGMGMGLSINMLTFVIIMAISMINILFLVFLNLKQPGF